MGISINTFTLKKDLYPIVYGGEVPNTRQGFDSSESRYCYADSLDKTLVSGKIVLCDSINTGASSITAGAVGTVMQDEGFHDVAFSFALPVSYMDFADGGNISKYINSTRNPMASIAKTTEIKQSAPAVVSFSSRGPNPITTDILKPDLTAPGVDILAAWTLATSITGSPTDNRIEPYNIISGTSMSCPAAYVKSFNPSFSPAAIKSALMTTGKFHEGDYSLELKQMITNNGTGAVYVLRLMVADVMELLRLLLQLGLLAPSVGLRCSAF